MLRIRRVLHPTDFLAGSEPALNEAVRVAREHGAELHLLHVIVLLAAEPSHPGLPMLADGQVYERLNELSEAALGKVRDGVDDRELVVHLETQRGFSVADVIVERAKSLDVDLLVMGTHGRRGAQRLLMGSVAEWVVRSIDRPVLVVREGVPERQRREDSIGKIPIEKILVPIDFSDYSGPALRTARLLADAYGASLDLLHVVYLQTHPLYGANTMTEIVDDLGRRSREAIEALWKSSGGPEVEYRIHVPTGRPAQVIAEFASEHDIDLVVVNSHGHGLERLLLGSTTEGILRRAACPVLTLRADGQTLIEEPPQTTQSGEG